MRILIKTFLKKVFKKSTFTHEEILVNEVMSEVQQLINTCCFKYLFIPMEMHLPIKGEDLKKHYSYIIKDGKMYLDIDNSINRKDLDFDKYCFLFDGVPSNFFDLENYELFFQNIAAIKAEFELQLGAKKALYGKNVLRH